MLRRQLKGLRQRAMGEETEYGLSISGPSFRIEKAILSPEDYVTRRLLGGASRRWLENGSGWYIDLNSHPEFTTYEGLTGQSVAAGSRLGDLVMVDVFETLIAEYPQLLGKRQIRLVRNNRDDDKASYGCHSNVQYLRTVTNSQLISCLLAFEVSGILLFGAGYTFLNRNDKIHYAVSQRAGKLDQIFSNDTTSHRPIINSKDEPLGNRKLYRRLHQINGDSNILWTPSWLKYDLRALLLLMMENDALPNYELDNPIAALHEINHNWRGRVWCIQSLRTGAEIQAWYLERAKVFVEQHRLSEYYQAIQTWSGLVDAFLNKDFDYLLGKVDWVTKGRLQDERQARWEAMPTQDRLDSPRDIELLRAEDRDYHTLLGGTGAARAVRKLYDPANIQELLEQAAIAPPTRAAVRGQAVQLAKDFNLDLCANWEEISLSQDDFEFIKIKIANPLQSSSDRLNQVEKYFRHQAR